MRRRSNRITGKRGVTVSRRKILEKSNFVELSKENIFMKSEQMFLFSYEFREASRNFV